MMLLFERRPSERGEAAVATKGALLVSAQREAVAVRNGILVGAAAEGSAGAAGHQRWPVTDDEVTTQDEEVAA
jgi:hypothetical protein